MFSQAFTELLKTKIIPQTVRVMDKVGQDSAERIVKALDVEVVRLGAIEIRSRAGEAPRKDKGYLQAGVGSDTSIDGLTVRTGVFAHRNEGEVQDVAVRLELGIGLDGRRPYMQPEFDRLKTELGSEIAKSL